MRIIKATEPIPVDHPVFMIFGQPGICKTSLAYSVHEHPLLLDFDKGSHRAVNRRDTVPIENWKDIEGLEGALDPYGAIVVDTVGRCLDVMTAQLAIDEPKLVKQGAPTLQGWGALKGRFRSWVSQLRTFGKDVLLVAHDKEDKDGDTRIVRPDIVGGSYAEVMKVADFVGYLYMSGKQRRLDFNPTDRWVGKNPAGWEPFNVPPAHKAEMFLADLFNKGREALGQISAESAEIANQIQDWRADIDTYRTAKDFNRAIPKIKKLGETVAGAQVAKLLMDAAKDAGLEFDREKKQFFGEAKKGEPEPARSMF